MSRARIPPSHAVLLALLLLGGAGRAHALHTQVVDRDGERYTLVELDLAQDRLELRWTGDEGKPLGGVEGARAWAQAHGRTLEFVTNAGIYDRELRPLGLHIEDGQQRRRLNTVRLPGTVGNFSMQPNGVFYIDQAGHAGVLSTEAWQRQPPLARIASQSGPMLLVEGQVNASFDAASRSTKIRSGVCAPIRGTWCSRSATHRCRSTASRACCATLRTAAMPCSSTAACRRSGRARVATSAHPRHSSSLGSACSWCWRRPPPQA